MVKKLAAFLGIMAMACSVGAMASADDWIDQGGGRWKAESGDTIWGLGQETGVDYKKILRANDLTEKTATTLQIGRVITVPGS